MSTVKNSNQNYTGLVQKYIGSAFDVVARVYESIAAVDIIAGSIDDGTFQFVADNMMRLAPL